MTVEELRAALRAAYATAQTDGEREGVRIAAVEIAVKLFPSMREYKAFLASVETVLEKVGGLDSEIERDEREVSRGMSR